MEGHLVWEMEKGQLMVIHSMVGIDILEKGSVIKEMRDKTCLGSKVKGKSG